MNVLFKIIFLQLICTSSFAKTCIDDTSKALQLGHSLRTEGQYLLSIQQYNSVSNFACSPAEKAAAILGTARALYNLGDFTAAEITLKQNPSAEGNLLGAWYQADLQTKLTSTQQKQFAEYKTLSLEISEKHKRKNLWVAGISSAIIPGLGQAYNGNYASAVFSFVVNSLFLATALELNKKNLQTSSIAAAMVFSITYTGNILSSIDSARTINRNAAAPHLDEQRKKSIPDLEL